jgi:hypothetical protein
MPFFEHCKKWMPFDLQIFFESCLIELILLTR